MKKPIARPAAALAVVALSAYLSLRPEGEPDTPEERAVCVYVFDGFAQGEVAFLKWGSHELGGPDKFVRVSYRDKGSPHPGSTDLVFTVRGGKVWGVHVNSKGDHWARFYLPRKPEQPRTAVPFTPSAPPRPRAPRLRVARPAA